MIVWLSVAACGSALADAGDSDRAKQISAVRIAKPPLIDGRLDDLAWIPVQPDERFTQNFPDEGSPPSERTEVRVAYTDRALFVGVRCHDREPRKIVERLTRRDRDTDADKVTVDIDSLGDHASAYHFDVNVSGVLADGVRFNDTDYNQDWDGLWNAATTRDPGGWSAEIEIPWRTLRFAGGQPEMGIQVRRYLQRRQEVDEWARIPRTMRAEVSRYGRLAGVRGLGPARLLQLTPYVAGTMSIRQGFGPNDDGTNGSTMAPSVGGDLKLGLSSDLTLDATINPDFGQVEADQVVLNLSTFEVFYPEKRPFFLEGSELFGTPIWRFNQFYSRRIGRSPPSPTLGAGETSVDVPLTGRIWGATKLSGRVARHLSIAVLDAVTAEQVGVVLRPGASVAEKRLIEPLSNFAVLRLRSDWGQSYVGVSATLVNRFEARDAAAPIPGMDLCPDGNSPSVGRCTHDAYTAGLDTRLVTADTVWGLAAHGVWSHIENGPTRTLADGSTVGSGANGVGLGLSGGKQGGEHFLFGVRYQGASPALDLNDAGYLREQNVHSFGASATLRSTRPLGRTLESAWDVFGFGRTSWSGEALLERGVGTSMWGRFANFWYAYVDAGYSLSHDDNREARDGTITERANAWWGDVYVKTDPRKRIVGEISFHAERTRHGVGLSSDLTVSLRPVPQLELSIVPRASHTAGDLRYTLRKDALEGGGQRYWYGDLESQSFDITLRGIYTFTPRLTLQTYAQVFVAAGHYTNFVTSDTHALACPAGANPCPFPRLALSSFSAAPSLGAAEDFRSGAINVNVLLRWEYLPGSTLMAVYTRVQAQPWYDYSVAGGGSPSITAFRGGPSVDSVLMKLAYLWR